MKYYVFLLILLLPVCAAAQPAYQPPPDSREAVKNVPWDRAAAIGQNFRENFAACDRARTGDRYPCPSPGAPARTLRNGCSENPNRNTALLKFPDGTVFFDGKMAVDADGSEYARRVGGVNQSETSVKIGNRSLDASKVPFIVVPQNASATVSFRKSTGTELGDLAVVVYKNKIIFAIVGDAGPSCRIGEGSIFVHEKAGNHICKNPACSDIHDNGIDDKVLYFIFPNTDVRKVPGMTMVKLKPYIETEGKKLFDRLRSPAP